MADIELVIKIPESYYKIITNKVKTARGDGVYLGWTAITNGTPLPKGHGRLKDVDKIISDGTSKGFRDWYDEMKYADTIIEADKRNEYEPDDWDSLANAERDH